VQSRIAGDCLVLPAAAQPANALLRDAIRQDVGTVSLLQTPAGVFCSSFRSREYLRVSMPIHIHAVGKCEPPSFDSAGPHFNPGKTRHGIMVGPGHAGDMPNLHIPPSGSLEVELVDTAITIDSVKPNSAFHPDGAAVVIYSGKDDYRTDPVGNAGNPDCLWRDQPRSDNRRPDTGAIARRELGSAPADGLMEG
jgi:Cu-Zn family superoxide dismutase